MPETTEMVMTCSPEQMVVLLEVEAVLMAQYDPYLNAVGIVLSGVTAAMCQSFEERYPHAG